MLISHGIMHQKDKRIVTISNTFTRIIFSKMEMQPKLNKQHLACSYSNHSKCLQVWQKIHKAIHKNLEYFLYEEATYG